VKVRIPAGVDDGARIRVKGRGSAGRSGGPPGDLYVTVHSGRSPLFERRGPRDLAITAPISFAEAALGTTIKVPTLDAPVSVKVPPGTPSGRVLRVRGRGVPAASGAGDLRVTIEVVVPTGLTDEQRAAVETLAGLLPAEELRTAAWGSMRQGDR
jgi:molecular chaperone DnaJ